MKILIGVVITLVAAGALYFALGTEKIDYVGNVDAEVAALQAEMAEINAAVASGMMTDEEAAVAQAKIVSRLDSINTAVAASANAQLTDAQKTMINDALDKLSVSLASYRETLVTVEAKAAMTNSGRSIMNALAQTITIVAETSEVAAEDVGALIDDIVADVEDVMSGEEMSEGEEMMNEDEEMMDGDMSDESVDDMPEAEGEMMNDDMSAEADVEAEVNVQ